MDEPTPAENEGLSRRRFITGIGAAAAAGAAVGAGGVAIATRGDDANPRQVVPFRGAHQAGITTAAQDRLHFAAFDVTTTKRDELVTLLKRWTEAADEMTQGREIGTYGGAGGPYLAPPEDTGEAIGLSAAHLTITFGFGPSLFVDAQGNDRFGLAARKPKVLHDLQAFPADALQPARSGGDLCIQACADDPQVAVHAVRNLARIAFGVASVRWSQLGFGRTSSTSTSQATPRNLFGFKDGTNNLKAEDPELLDRFVWVQRGDDPAATWMVGGSYLVARRIRMHIETWDRTSLAEQETIFGRDKREGAPLSGGTEFSPIDFTAQGRNGPLIAVDSHVALSNPANNDGITLLRRGYNFTDGSDGRGHLDAGLFFIAFTRDPDAHFVPIQLRLARQDLLNEYIQHTGSALFAVPPGVRGGEHIGQALFA